MPRVATCALIWSQEQENYALLRAGEARAQPVEGEAWPVDLARHASFAFRGRRGHLTLRKERRQRGGEGYWYAYRNDGRKTLKKYAGRSCDLSIARLEEIAAALNPTSEPVPMPAVTSRGTLAPLVRSDSEDIPLLAAKLSPPRLPADLLTREELLRRLGASLENTRMTLLCAPAGYGKTTLAAQWLAGPGGQRAVAWVALDSRDNDPMRFWRYVLTACRRFHETAALAALAHLRALEAAPVEARSLEVPLTLLLNALDQASGRGILVLEDYHVIDEPHIHASLAFLLTHLPETLHVVLLTRTEPPLPLAHLRVAGTLREFGTQDLRLTRQETRAFLVSELVQEPTPEVVNRLEELVEGWVTGLRLFTLTCPREAGVRTLEEYLSNFSGSQRHLLDYFLNEVLETQPPDVQTFLLQTSLCERFTASLCEVLSGRRESALLLSELERAHLFLSPLEGQERWYRYHPLFAEALRHAAHWRLDEQTRRACYERASAWYADQGQMSEAIEAALAASAFAHAAELIERITGPQRFHEMREHQTLQRWLLALPEETLRLHPALCLTLAMAHLFASDCQQILSPEVLARSERPLRMAEEAWRREETRAGLGEALAFRVVLARFQGEFGQAGQLARQALAWLAKDAHQWRATCLTTLGGEYGQAGDLPMAAQTVREAYRCFGLAGNHYGQRVSLLMLAELEASQRQLHASAALYREVLAASDDDFADRGQALLGLAGLAYEWNDLPGAETQAREALAAGRQVGDEQMQLRAQLLLAMLHAATNQIEVARKELAGLRARASMQSSPLLHRQMLVSEALFQCREGRSPLPWPPCDPSLPAHQQEREKLLQARLLAVQGESGAALDLLSQVRARASEQGRGRDELEALLLAALLHHQWQQSAQAALLLQEALELARSQGYTRIFLDEGQPMEELLRSVPPSPQRDQAAYQRRLLQAFAAQKSGLSLHSPAEAVLSVPALEPLSSQEERVLRLLLAGHSNGEIAHILVVSTNTIKTQVQSIYRKLNVHSRREARQLLRGHPTA